MYLSPPYWFIKLLINLHDETAIAAVDFGCGGYQIK
jgi:hypothetical protein